MKPRTLTNIFYYFITAPYTTTFSRKLCCYQIRGQRVEKEKPLRALKIKSDNKSYGLSARLDRALRLLEFRFFVFSFFFFFSPSQAVTVYVLYINSNRNIWPVFHEHLTSFINFFIKNGSHGTIHTFKNYFTTVFSVFNFNKISFIQINPESW